MAARCHKMTFFLSAVRPSLKITGNRKVASHWGHAAVSLIASTLVPVRFDYPVTLLDPLNLIFPLFRPSRADTPTLTSCISADISSTLLSKAVGLHLALMRGVGTTSHLVVLLHRPARSLVSPRVKLSVGGRRKETFIP